jgi:hypothetical protein
MSNTEIRDQAVVLLNQAIEVLGGITDADVIEPEPPDNLGDSPVGIYHGAYIDGTTMAQYYGDAYNYTVPWDPDGICQEKFEQDAGKSIAISHWGTGSANVPFWDSDADDMISKFQEANHRSCYPLLDSSSASVFLGDIAGGDYDVAIELWFQKMAEYARPFLLRWNTEMNGEWYGYGSNDIQGPDQPQNFVNAWRHIHDIADSVGANNISWHWAPNSLPPWDVNYFPWPFEAYYPGDEYVDWSGFVCYQQGKTTSEGDWSYLSGPSYDAALACAPDKPMAISEWSSFFEFTAPPKNQEHGYDSNKGDWLRHALEYVRDFQPAIRAMVMFNTGYSTGKMEHNEIQTSDAAKKGYQRGVSDNDIYIGRRPQLSTSGKVPIPVRP